jgi:hypothetical protein
MSDDNTKALTDREILSLILSRLGSVEDRLAALEAAETERRNETRPKLNAIHAFVDQLNEDMKTVKADIREIKRDVRLLREDIRNERLARVELAERVENLEGRRRKVSSNEYSRENISGSDSVTTRRSATTG